MGASIFHSRRLQSIGASQLQSGVYLCLALIPLIAGAPACVAFDCHFADSSCNPLASVLLTGSAAATCLDPDYSAPADAISVISPADSGAGTLRQAITDAPNGGSVDLTGVGGAIVLASVLPTISKDIDFYGACGPTQTIDGAHALRIFRITGGATVSLFYLTLRNGNATGGAGDFVAGSPPAPTGGGGGSGMGGGIFIDGSARVTISQSGFSDNVAAGGAGGFGVSGAGGGGWEGKNGGAPAHDTAFAGIPTCPLAAGPFGTGGAGGCTSTINPGQPGGAGGYGAGSGGGGSGDPSGAAAGAPGAFGGSGGAGCTGAFENAPSGGGGGGGLGGAIAVHGAGTTLSISDSTFVNNTATGGAGGASVNCNPGAAGEGKGGAIFADAGGAVTQSNLIMSGNSATDQTAAANDNVNVYGFNFP